MEIFRDAEGEKTEKRIMKTDANKYYLAHNGLDVFHFGNIESNQVLSTGQPILEMFLTKIELEARLTELESNSDIKAKLDSIRAVKTDTKEIAQKG